MDGQVELAWMAGSTALPLRR